MTVSFIPTGRITVLLTPGQEMNILPPEAWPCSTVPRGLCLLLSTLQISEPLGHRDQWNELVILQRTEHPKALRVIQGEPPTSVHAPEENKTEKHQGTVFKHTP